MFSEAAVGSTSTFCCDVGLHATSTASRRIAM
jgi:hypothetical protein